MLKLTVHVASKDEALMTSLLYQYDCLGIEVISQDMFQQQQSDPYGEIYTLNPEDYPEKGVFLIAYYPEQETDPLLESIKASILTYNVGLCQPIDVIQFEPIDYTKQYEASVEEVRVNRISIVPSWHNRIEDDREYIWIEPGTGFGTGSHETTRHCLMFIEQWIKPTDVVIDVGTGSGILALRASMLTQGDIHAVEVDAMALKNAKHNAHLNEKAIHFYDSLDAVSVKADLLIANIVCSILIDLLPSFKERLKPNGILILSGILLEERQEFERAIMDEEMIIVDNVEGDAFIAYVAQVKD